MGAFTRITTFLAATVIDPDIHNAEHDGIASAINDNDTRLDDLETANISYAGHKTWLDFATFVQGIFTNDITERTSCTGIRMNSYVRMQDNQLFVLGHFADQAAEDNPPCGITEGAMMWRSDLHKLRIYGENGWETVRTGVSSSSDGNFIDSRFIPTWTSTSTVTFPSGLAAKDSTENSVITLQSDIVADITSSGAGGLDSGSVAPSTHYAAYIIGNSAGSTPASIVFSTEFDPSVGPSMPSGFDIFRRLNMWVTTNSSSNIIDFSITGGWPFQSKIQYNVRPTYFNTPSFPSFTAGDLNVLSQGSATSDTDLNLGNYLPTIAKTALLSVATDHAGTGTYYAHIKRKGASGYGKNFIGSGAVMVNDVEVPTSDNQTIVYSIYFNTSASYTGMWVDVMGGVVGEVS